MTKVRKAVLPVAGLGTRMLPGSKATPKNLLNVFDRPILSYVLAEARDAGIETFVIVVGEGQEAIARYFTPDRDLEDALAAKGRTDILEDLQADMGRPGELHYVRQEKPLGLGHAIGCARPIIGEEPFAVMLPDMLIDATPSALGQAVAAWEKVGGNIIVVEPAPEGQAHKYGIVALDNPSGRLNRMTGMVEKPAPGTEPSNLFASGRYILQPAIWPFLESQGAGAGGEIQLTDAMIRLMADQPFHALEYEGTTYDCGDKVGLLRANLAFALKHPSLGAEARAMAEALLKT